MIEKVWGESEGLCAWCNAKAKASYVGEMSNGEIADYQVCLSCHEERV